MPADEEHAFAKHPFGVSSDETVTLSPEATTTLESTATPVQVPAPRDFTENFDSPSSYWTTFGTNNVIPDVQLQNGFWFFNLTKTNTWADTILQRPRLSGCARGRASRSPRGKRWHGWNCLPIQPNQWLV